ncbi:hypothetical protein GGF50DRAFT_127293 [Schizophyllum commune]
MPDMSTLQPTSRPSRDGSFAASGSTPHAPSRSHTISRPSHRASDTPAADLKRHASLWCTEPKGIVIRAQNWIFRVPEGRLRRMALMFPMREEGRWSTFEGSPMIELPHSSTDVELFLFALFNEESLDKIYRIPLSDEYAYRCPAAILRLSGVYYAQRCRSRALRLLARMFPADLNSLDRLLRPSRSQDFGIAQVNSWFVVDAARAARARWLLPSAALFLLSESFRNRKVDRQLRTEELEMRRRYMSLWSECVKRMCAPPPRKGDCGSRRCDAELANFAKAVRTDSTKAFSMSIVLGKKSRMIKKMCYTCTKGFSSRYGELRQWFWSLLPAVCGLEDSWAVLLQEMRRDLRESDLA